MSAYIPRLAATAPTEQIVNGLQEHGAAIVEGVISPDLLARFNAELDTLLERVSPDRRYLNPAIDHAYRPSGWASFGKSPRLWSGVLH
jgi:aspartate/tyrosine/aromatic aminotransferase